MAKAEDMTGQKFGRWTVLRRAENDRWNKSMWLCKCECGNERQVLGKSLRVGESLSCGCLRTENQTKHGLNRTLEYSSWIHMKGRCYIKTDKRYKDYGGRGITVCDRWIDSFENFLSDMGKRPGKEYSLDRIDVNGNYEPSNCKWSTSLEQNRNRRFCKKVVS